MGLSVSIDPFGSTRISFKSGDRSTFDSSELTASYFPLELLGVEHGPTMFVVTFKYSTLENNFLFRDRRLLAELEAADNRLKLRAWLSKSRDYMNLTSTFYHIRNMI